MKRKKWTITKEITPLVINIREKRKWQIALRRYILEKNLCVTYAPYFGIDINTFRKWIELQFKEGQEWENFGNSWQFDHVIPLVYFDFGKEDDLKLCWNFINIRVESVKNENNKANRVDIISAKKHFEALFDNTGYSICKKMIEKIAFHELSQTGGKNHLELFIKENIGYLQALSGFGAYEFNKLNEGDSLKNIILEKEILKKFGS